MQVFGSGVQVGLEQPRESEHGVERRANLVAEIGEKDVFGLRGGLGLLHRNVENGPRLFGAHVGLNTAGKE